MQPQDSTDCTDNQVVTPQDTQPIDWSDSDHSAIPHAVNEHPVYINGDIT